MKLLNLDEEAPSEFYIFVNHYSPITEHNLRVTGQFISGAFANLLADGTFLQKYIDGSANYLPFERCNDLKVFTPYCVTAINDYRIEYDAEICRKNHFPIFPSRLSALYAFGDYESCKEVNRKYGWPLKTVKKFQLIDRPLNRVIKVNMEHVSLARHAYKVSMLATNDIDMIWRKYWAGFGNIDIELHVPDMTRKIFSSGVIWEYLIEGGVKLIK